MKFDLAKWVLDARNHACLTQEELAYRVNLGGKASISAFEKGRNKPTFQTIWDIGNVCRYPLPQNKFNENNSVNTKITNNKGVIEQNTVHGNGTQTINNFNKNDSLNDHTFPMGDSSMTPVIPEQARLWVDRDDRKLRDGKIYLLEHGGLECVRRLFLRPNNQIRVVAYNSKDYPEEITPTEEIRIIGRVVQWCVID